VQEKPILCAYVAHLGLEVASFWVRFSTQLNLPSFVFNNMTGSLVLFMIFFAIHSCRDEMEARGTTQPRHVGATKSGPGLEPCVLCHALSPCPLPRLAGKGE